MGRDGVTGCRLNAETLQKGGELPGTSPTGDMGDPDTAGSAQGTPGGAASPSWGLICPMRGLDQMQSSHFLIPPLSLGWVP